MAVFAIVPKAYPRWIEAFHEDRKQFEFLKETLKDGLAWHVTGHGISKAPAMRRMGQRRSRRECGEYVSKVKRDLLFDLRIYARLCLNGKLRP